MLSPIIQNFISFISVLIATRKLFVVFFALHFILLDKPLLYCQNITTANHDGVDNSGNIVSIGARSFYFKNVQGGSCCNRRAFVVCVNKIGQVLFEKPMSQQVGRVQTFTKIIKTKDNKVLIIGDAYYACDIINQKSIILKLDTLGNILFEKIVSNVVSFISYTDITQFSDSSYYISIANGTIEHYSKNGIYLNQITPSINLNLKSVTQLSNNHLLISGNQGTIPYLVEIDTSGNVIQQKQVDQAVTKIIELQNGVLVGRTIFGNIETYHSTLAKLNTYTITAVEDFAILNDSIHITGSVGPNQNWYYHVLDTSLIQHHTFVSNYKFSYPTGICIGNNRKVNLIMRAISGSGSQMPFTSYRSFPVFGTPHGKTDIGIRRVEVNKFSLTEILTVPYSHINLDIVVENYGQDTITSFYLNHFARYTECLTLLHKYTICNLLPGDSMRVNTGDLSFPLSLSSKTNSRLGNSCLYTSLPNNTHDIQTSNDAWCDNILVYVGTEENTSFNSNILIYPNPANTQLNISVSDENLKSIQLLDLSGKSVLSKSFDTEQTTYTLDVSQLIKGLYIAQLQTEKEKHFLKVMKE